MKQFFEEYGKTVLAVICVAIILTGWTILKTDLGSLVISNVSAWFYDIDLSDVPEAPPEREPEDVSAVLLAAPIPLSPLGTSVAPFSLKSTINFNISWTSIHQQSMYRLKLLDISNKAVYDSGLVFTTDTQALVPNLHLIRESTYLWEVQIWNEDGYMSEPSDKQYLIYEVPAEAVAGDVYLSILPNFDGILYCPGWTGGTNGYAFWQQCSVAKNISKGTYNFKFSVYNQSRDSNACISYRIIINGTIIKEQGMQINRIYNSSNMLWTTIPITIEEQGSTFEFHVIDGVCRDTHRVGNTYLGVLTASGDYIGGRYWEN